MSTLDDPRHEAFAMALARGASLRQAATEANLHVGKPNRAAALAGSEAVIDRVAEIRALGPWGDAPELKAVYEKAMELAGTAGELGTAAGMMAAKALLSEAARARQSLAPPQADQTGPARTDPAPIRPVLTREEWLAAFAPPR
jgi:hypothetical protein